MFGAFERAVAGRYLRARKGERFVSIIAIFSLVGIALGVATLIIVMSVMSGIPGRTLSAASSASTAISRSRRSRATRLTTTPLLAAHPRHPRRRLGDPGASMARCC